MTVTLEGPRRIGSCWIAAVVEHDVIAGSFGRLTHVRGSKQARAILLVANRTITAFTPEGAPLKRNAVDRLYPDAIRRLRDFAGKGEDGG